MATISPKSVRDSQRLGRRITKHECYLRGQKLLLYVVLTWVVLAHRSELRVQHVGISCSRTLRRK